MGESSADPYDGPSGSFPVRVQEVAVTSDRHDPEGAVHRTSDPAQDKQEPADHLSGRVLDNRYLIGSRIARGGLAPLYEAHHPRPGPTPPGKGMDPRPGGGDQVPAPVV